MNKELISHERLKEILRYDPETGEFTWLERVDDARFNTNFAGRRAGNVPNGNDYVRTTIDEKRYLMHRLAWFYMTGQWPPHDTDHINGNRKDNRFCNLRLASRSENNMNAKVRRNGTKYKGIVFHKVVGKWWAEISIEKKPIYLGMFETLEEAVYFREYAAQYYHGEFARAV